VSQWEWVGEGCIFQAELHVFYTLPSSLTLAFLQAATTYYNIDNSQQEQACQRFWTQQAYHWKIGMLFFRDVNDMMLGMNPEPTCNLLGIFFMIPLRGITNHFEVTKPFWKKIQQCCSHLQSLTTDRVLLLEGWDQDLKYQGPLKYLMVDISDAKAINTSAWSIMILLP